MNKLSSKQYYRYLMISTFTGIATVVIRHFFAMLLPADLPKYYMLSIIFAYAFGIVLNFFLQKSFTFTTEKQPLHRKKVAFISFVIVAIFGAVATLGIAIFIRYTLRLDLIFNQYSATIAFVIAAVISSILSYVLNAKIVFAEKNANNELIS